MPMQMVIPCIRADPQACSDPQHSPQRPGQLNALMPRAAAARRTARWYSGSSYRSDPTFPFFPSGR